jgi:hypothetical protein
VIIHARSEILKGAEIGPGLAFRFVGGLLYKEDERDAIARYRGGYWQVQSADYGRLEIDGPVVVQLREPEDGGDIQTDVYANVWFADGILRDPTRAIVALEENREQWRDAATDRRFREVVIQPATR